MKKIFIFFIGVILTSNLYAPATLASDWPEDSPFTPPRIYGVYEGPDYRDIISSKNINGDKKQNTNNSENSIKPGKSDDKINGLAKQNNFQDNKNKNIENTNIKDNIKPDLDANNKNAQSEKTEYFINLNKNTIKITSAEKWRRRGALLDSIINLGVGTKISLIAKGNTIMASYGIITMGEGFFNLGKTILEKIGNIRIEYPPFISFTGESVIKVGSILYKPTSAAIKIFKKGTSLPGFEESFEAIGTMLDNNVTKKEFFNSIKSVFSEIF